VINFRRASSFVQNFLLILQELFYLILQKLLFILQKLFCLSYQSFIWEQPMDETYENVLGATPSEPHPSESHADDANDENTAIHTDTVVHHQYHYRVGVDAAWSLAFSTLPSDLFERLMTEELVVVYERVAGLLAEN